MANVLPAFPHSLALREARGSSQRLKWPRGDLGCRLPVDGAEPRHGMVARAIRAAVLWALE